jgi:choloylglycine hydrolase
MPIPTVLLARLAAAFLLTISIAARLAACSTFVLRHGGSVVFGRNFDWGIGYGLICVNQKDLQKTVSGASLTWASRYGSITFNQYGKEHPMDGMNEAGLVVAQMWLDGTRYPSADARPAVSELTWIQYQLDNCASVEEVIATDAVVRISPGSSPLHFLVADSSGDAAVIEFLNGAMVVHRGEDLLAAVLTNSTYDESAQYLRRHVGFGGSRPIPASLGSKDRFVRAADWVAQYAAHSADTPIVDYAFAALASVAAPGFTQWSIVYEAHSRAVHFRTLACPAIKTVQLGAFDLRCRSASRILDIDYATPGDVSARFDRYTTAANRDLIYKSYRGTDFLSGIPDSTLDSIAAFPATFQCLRPTVGKRTAPRQPRSWP